MATTTALLALVPLAGAEDDSLSADEAEYVCVPAQDRTATSVTVGAATYYERLYSNGAYYMQELWQDTNGERGLQTARGMSCIGKADVLVRSACIGVCPMTL